MSKSWQQSLIYFINVIFHIGVFWVLFTVAIPDHMTTQEHIIDFWSYSEGKETILINTAFLIGNFLFALIVILFLNKSLFMSKVLAFTAWSLVLIIYLYGASGIIFTYILGAILLTTHTISKHKNA